jgi:nicotinamidase-related amidase
MTTTTITSDWGLILVDPQNTFVRPADALSVPEASELCLMWANLLSAARAGGAPIVGLARTAVSNAQHPSPDFGAKGVDAGQVLESQLQGPVFDTSSQSDMGSDRQLDELPRELTLTQPADQVWDDPLAERILEKFRGRGVQAWVVAGVKTDHDVKSTVLSLRSHDWPVYLLTDAVQGGTESGTSDALREMKEAGASLIESATALIHWKKKTLAAS